MSDDAEGNDGSNSRQSVPSLLCSYFLGKRSRANVRPNGRAVVQSLDIPFVNAEVSTALEEIVGNIVSSISTSLAPVGKIKKKNKRITPSSLPLNNLNANPDFPRRDHRHLTRDAEAIRW